MPNRCVSPDDPRHISQHSGMVATRAAYLECQMIDAGYGERGLPQAEAQEISDMVHSLWEFSPDQYARVEYQVERTHPKALAQYIHGPGERPVIRIYKGGDSAESVIHEASHALQYAGHLLTHHNDRKTQRSHDARFLRSYEAAVMQFLDQADYKVRARPFDAHGKRPLFTEQGPHKGAYMGGKPRPCKAKGCNHKTIYTGRCRKHRKQAKASLPRAQATTCAVGGCETAVNPDALSSDADYYCARGRHWVCPQHVPKRGDNRCARCLEER